MPKLSRSYTAFEIANMVSGVLHGNPHAEVDAVHDFKEGGIGSLVFLDPGVSLGGRVTCAMGVEPFALADVSIVVSHPRRAMRDFLIEVSHLDRSSSIHPTAQISPHAKLGQRVSIGPYAVILDDVCISDDSVIGSHAHLDVGVRIGSDSYIGSHVSLLGRAQLGNRVQVGPGAVIGDAGFGYDHEDQQWVMFPQLASVIVEDDVHIGPLCVIDRGALSDTRIGCGSKLDAQVMIGHGVVIGKQVIMAGACSIGGSSIIGDGVMMGGRVAIADHVFVAARTQLAGGCMVGKSIFHPDAYVSTFAALPRAQWLKWFRNLLRSVQ